MQVEIKQPENINIEEVFFHQLKQGDVFTLVANRKDIKKIFMRTETGAVWLEDSVNKHTNFLGTTCYFGPLDTIVRLNNVKLVVQL